jgi:hypothetical protein
MEAVMYYAKYKELAGEGGNTYGSWICYYYDNLKKQTPQDTEEIKNVEDYMKKTTGLDDVNEAYDKITRDAIDCATGEYGFISDCQ